MGILIHVETPRTSGSLGFHFRHGWLPLATGQPIKSWLLQVEKVEEMNYYLSDLPPPPNPQSKADTAAQLISP